MSRLNQTLKTSTFVLLVCGAACTHIGFAQADALEDVRHESAATMAFALNGRLGNAPVTIEARGNRLTLSGAVETNEDKALAAHIAQAVSGATTIDNQLTLDPSLGERPAVKTPQQIQLDDYTLAAMIGGRLAWNTDTATSSIEVSVQGGVVTLKGQAATVDAKEWAGTLATDTQGVIVVNNLISLRAADTGTTHAQVKARGVDPAISDAWIANKVAISFQNDRNLDASRVEIKVREGMVTMSGDVTSAAHKRQAMEVARRLRGVRGVDADLLKVTAPTQP